MPPTLDPAVVTARKEAARRALAAAADADFNARLIQAQADHEDVAVDQDAATTARQDADDLIAESDSVIAAQKADKDALQREVDKARRDALTAQVDEWKRLRAVHQDFVDNPDVYGGKDFSGAPLDADAQRSAVAQLDIAIAAAQGELDGLVPNRATRRAEAKAAKGARKTTASG